MNPDFLNLSRSQDLADKKERILYRFLEIVPGFLAWGTLGAAFILSWLAPIAVAVFIIIFAVYWLLKVFYLAFHQTASFLQMKKNLKTNWLKKLSTSHQNLAGGGIENWRDIYHLIILPMYKENIEIVRNTCQSLADSEYPKEKMIVVLAVEEKAGEAAQEVVKKIEKEFLGIFFRFLVTCHPKDIVGEIAGKGANVAWAIKKTKEEIFDESRTFRQLSRNTAGHSASSLNGEQKAWDKLSIPYQNIIVSIFDIDTRPYPQYFACLTYHYLTCQKPLKSSYQPIPVYNNNIWEAPAFSRVIATSGTFWQMMQQARPEQLVTYSSHSMPFKMLEEVGYPSNLVSDDSRIFWKSYLYYGGDFRVVPLYYPVSMDTVMAKTLPRTVVNQYRQQRRWAWGVENIPYLIYNFLKNPGSRMLSGGVGKKISLFEKLRHMYILLDGFWSWATVALLIFFLGWLPLILGGEKFNITLLAYNLPRLTSVLMTVAMIGMFVSATISFLLLPPRPKDYSKLKNLSMIFQWLFLPLTLIFFGAFPALDAQTRLMLNKFLGFWVTEKARRNRY